MTFSWSSSSARLSLTVASPCVLELGMIDCGRWRSERLRVASESEAAEKFGALLRWLTEGRR